jgi:hypothetical protein
MRPSRRTLWREMGDFADVRLSPAMARIDEIVQQFGLWPA